jgi:putative two-component system response regulator
MLAISDAILQTPGPLSDDDYETVKSHPTVGDALCANLESLQAVRPIIRWHHERVDGSGYPDGLRGAEIPLTAQIVGVVEIFEALTTPRPYQEHVTPGDALVLLHRHADRGWLSTDVVGALEQVVGTREASVPAASQPAHTH